MRTRHRILHVVLNDYTRDTRVDRAARLGVEMGADVMVAALWSRGLPEHEQRDGYRVLRIPLWTRRLPRRRSVQLIKFGELVGRVGRLGGRLSPSIVHAHDFNALIPAAVAARRSGAGLLYDSHELWADRMRGGGELPGVLLRLGVLVERALARRADAAVTVSEGIADELAERWGTKRPAVVRNVPETREVVAGEARHEPGPLRRSLHVPVDVPVLLYQGGIIPGRGLSALVEAMEHMEDPQAVLVLLGSGPLSESLRGFVRSRGLEQRVRFHEAVRPEVLPLWTADADLGLSPIEGTCLSYELCLPNKLFEYLHAGLPVLVSDQPEMQRLVERHSVGRVFPDGDAEALARTLDEMLADPEPMAQWRSAARRASETLNWANESRILRALYEDLLMGAETSGNRRIRGRAFE